MGKLVLGLHNILPSERIKARRIDRYAYAGYASRYYLVPKVVIQPLSIEEIKSVFDFSNREKINIHFGRAVPVIQGRALRMEFLLI